MQLTPEIYPMVIAAVLMSFGAMATAVVISAATRDGKWPFRVAIASLVPPAAVVFLGVRHIIATFQAISAAGSGGIGSVAAGMWESLQPLLFASEVSVALLVVVGAIGLVTWKRASEPSGLGVSITITIACGLIAIVPAALLRYLCGWLLDVLAPGSKITMSLGAVSQRTATLLLTTSVSALAAATLLFAITIVGPLFIRMSFSRRSALAVLVVAALALTASVVVAHRWSERLREIAISGSMANRPTISP